MSVYKEVETIVSESDEARDYDIELIIGYMQRHGVGLTKKQENKIRTMNPISTVLRARRDKKMMRDYPPSPEALEQRHAIFGKVQGEANEKVGVITKLWRKFKK